MLSSPPKRWDMRKLPKKIWIATIDSWCKCKAVSPIVLSKLPSGRLQKVLVCQMKFSKQWMKYEWNTKISNWEFSFWRQSSLVNCVNSPNTIDNVVFSIQIEQFGLQSMLPIEWWAFRRASHHDLYAVRASFDVPAYRNYSVFLLFMKINWNLKNEKNGYFTICTQITSISPHLSAHLSSEKINYKSIKNH